MPSIPDAWQYKHIELLRTKDTNTAVLDAVSEEINNSIFRKGHTRLGFSSGLSGSGMAFEYDLFKR